MKKLLTMIKAASLEVATYIGLGVIAVTIVALFATSAFINCICYPFKKLKEGYNWILNKFRKEVVEAAS